MISEQDRIALADFLKREIIASAECECTGCEVRMSLAQLVSTTYLVMRGLIPVQEIVIALTHTKSDLIAFAEACAETRTADSSTHFGSAGERESN